ncbi:MAG: outer membrane protein transport protein [bacterium]
MRMVRASVAAMMLCLILSAGLAASGFEGLGVGARAIGMGGAFRAIADDWTAAYYNPAGYGDIFDAQLGGNLALVHYRNEITPDYRWDGGYETGVVNDIPLFNHHEILSNPSVGFMVRLPVWGETVFGLSAYQPFDYNVEWQLFGGLTGYNNSLKPGARQYANNFDVVAFQLTAGREFIENKLNLGVGLALLRADLNYSNIYLRDNPYLLVDPEWPFADRPFDKIVQWNREDGYGFGFGVRLGALWHQSDKLDLGVTAFYPFDITISGDGYHDFYMPRITGAEDLEGVAGLLQSGSLVIDSSEFETTITLPPSFGAGLAYQVSEKLLASLDFEFTLWSQFEGFAFDYASHHIYAQGVFRTAVETELMQNFFNQDLTRPVQWDNAFKVAAGAQYVYNESLTLLGGVNYDQSPAKGNELQTPQIVDLGNKLGLSGGLVVHIQEWDLSLATNYIHHPDGSSPGLTDLDGDGNYDNFTGAYGADTYQTVLSVNYRF